MKRFLISSCMFLFLLVGTQSFAQDKVKMKDDKTKTKEGDSKEKMKDDKTKMKDGMDDKTKMKNDKMKVKDDEGKLKAKSADDMNAPNPYTASYSSNFAIGNPAHTNMVVDLWKDWDDNSLDRHDFFADTLTMQFSDGTLVKGKAENMEAAKKFRGSLTSSKSTIDAMIPLRSTDRNEDWVAMWGTETNVTPDGKTEVRDVHEIWRINKDGKIDFMKQFAATRPKQ